MTGRVCRIGNHVPDATLREPASGNQEILDLTANS